MSSHNADYIAVRKSSLFTGGLASVATFTFWWTTSDAFYVNQPKKLLKLDVYSGRT